jgi:MFS family permease
MAMALKATSEKGFYGWINVGTTSIMGVIGGLYLISFSYFLNYLVKDFGWKTSSASLASTVNMIAMGLCGPLAGAFIIKYGAKRAIFFGNILGIAGFSLMYFHSRLWELYLAYGVLIGVGVGFGGLLASNTVICNWFVRKRSIALGICLGAGGAGGIFMGRAIVYCIETIGWRKTCLVISALILLFNVIMPLILIRNKPQDLKQVPDGPDAQIPAHGKSIAPSKSTYKTPVDFTSQEAMRTRALWLLIAYYCLNMMAMNALMTHLFRHMLDIGISSTLASYAFGTMSSAMTLSNFGAGFLGRKYSLLSIAVGAEVLKICGMMVLVFAHSIPLVFAFMVLLGAGFGAVMLATMNIFPDYFGISHYPKIMGIVRLFWAFLGGLGAPFAGYIRDTQGSFLPAFRITILLVAAGLICLIFAKPPVHPSLRRGKTEKSLAAAVS